MTNSWLDRIYEFTQSKTAKRTVFFLQATVIIIYIIAVQVKPYRATPLGTLIILFTFIAILTKTGEL